jgi:lysozyme
MNTEKFKQQLIINEGLLNRPYRDTVGKLTIGVGRNLDDVGISTSEAMFLLDNDIKRVLDELVYHLTWFNQLDDIRQRVIADMTFNMGFYGLLTFSKMLKCLKEQDYVGTAKEMENSKWFKQTGLRAIRLKNMMETGVDSYDKAITGKGPA